MTTGVSADFGDLIAQRIREAHREIARRWLHRLEAVLPLDRNEIFPSEQILDHIPALIHEIADHVSADRSDPVVANTLVLSKAAELGELRFAQKASVHQLLREYRILAGVLGAFVHEQFQELAIPSNSVDGIAVLNQLNEAVFVLLQTTVDTFVGKYIGQIEEQTTRLEGFNRMVTHELRQPLSSVQYAVELLKAPTAVDDDQRTLFLDVADRNVKRLAQLLSMLGAITRTDQDNPQLQAVDLAKTVSDVFRQLRDAAASKNVTLKSDIPSTAITLDLSRLELVLMNLIANGIKYRDPDKSDRFVEVLLEEQPNGCRLLVRDNGLGIPADDQPKVFRRFHRAHSEMDKDLGVDGVGLGLAIAAECVKSLKGTLTFASTIGVGTTFTLTLPIDAPNEPPSYSPERPRPPE